METQANAPASAQAQTPVQQQHPIIEEQSIVERLTKYVKDNPDNDPHHPENTSQPRPSEEAQSETSAEATAEEQVEFDEETPFFELDYNGEKKKLSAKELREGYLAKQDYHRNIQKVKAEEASVQERVRTETLKAQQEYVQRLEVHKQAVAKLAGVKSMAEIEALSKQDPAAAQQEFLRMISVNQTLQQIEGEQRQAAQRLQEQQQAALQTTIAKSRQTLESDIPGWGEKLYQEVLSNVTKDYGFEGKDVAQVVDARLIKVFHDAYQYRQLQRAKPEISKKVVTVPKVVKPGSAEKPNPTSEAAQDAEKRFKKSGDWRDAAHLYLARQKQKK